MSDAEQTFVKIAAIDNEMEAHRLDEMLDEHDVPHFLRSYHDSVYDGLYQASRGWGHVEAPVAFREQARALLDQLRSG